MEETTKNYFVVFLLGLGTMITFHNTILSARKYLTRNYGKMSDMLRIVCNYGNLWRFLVSIGYFMTPSNVTDASCKALGYLYLIGYHLFHISLFAFLFWALYRMSLSKKDLWGGIVFLIIQTSLIIPEMISVKPSSALPSNLYNSTAELLGIRICDMTFSTYNFRSWTMVTLGFLMEFYLIVRLSYLAKNRRRINVPVDVKATNDSDDSSTSTPTPNVVAVRNPIDLPTISWTLALSMLALMLVWLSSSLDEKPDKIILLGSTNVGGLAYKTLLYISISYLITYLDNEKRKNIIFYNCGGRNASENPRNSVNKLDGEAWVICSKKEKKKDTSEEVGKIDASAQV